MDMDRPNKLLEQSLVLQYQTGNVKAFERIFFRYSSRLEYFVRRLLAPRSDVEDICQDIWLAAFRGLRRLRSPEALSVWLYRIARNRTLREFGKAGRSSEPVDVYDMPHEPENESFSPDDAEAIHNALGRIKPQHREVLVLRFLEELPYEQIAQVVGCSPGTVKSRIHYAKRALRVQMEAPDHDQH